MEQQLPFDIPKSLSVYLEQFEDDPLKVTGKLKNHLNRRGPDAVGYFLLAWLYHLKDMNETAIEYALAAKTFAPGSPLMEKLHYYLSHPDNFDAWTPDEDISHSSKKSTQFEQPEPILDLDHLIERLSKVENKRIKLSEKRMEGDSGNNLEDGNSEPATETDDIVSETLAKIHEAQGKTREALRIYEKLIRLKPDKKKKYSKQISRLEKKIEEQEK